MCKVSQSPTWHGVCARPICQSIVSQCVCEPILIAVRFSSNLSPSVTNNIFEYAVRSNNLSYVFTNDHFNSKTETFPCDWLRVLKFNWITPNIMHSDGEILSTDTDNASDVHVQWEYWSNMMSKWTLSPKTMWMRINAKCCDNLSSRDVLF